MAERGSGIPKRESLCVGWATSRPETTSIDGNIIVVPPMADIPRFHADGTYKIMQSGSQSGPSDHPFAALLYGRLRASVGVV